LRSKRFREAEYSVRELCKLPAHSGFLPPLACALSAVAAEAAGDRAVADDHKARLGAQAQFPVAGLLVLTTLSKETRQKVFRDLPKLNQLSPADRQTLPAAAANAIAILEPTRIPLDIPPPWLNEVRRQLQTNPDAVDPEGLLGIGRRADAAGMREFAFETTAVGLELHPSWAADFLLLRAEVLSLEHDTRAAVCAAAAAQIARDNRNLAVVKNAAAFLHNKLGTDAPPLPPAAVAEVLAKESAHPKLPRTIADDPDYRSVLRRDPLSLDDDEDYAALDALEFEDMLDEIDIPSDMPPELARLAFEAFKDALKNGADPDMLMERLLTSGVLDSVGGPPPGTRRKRRKKR
jgi:hypothetical protein